MSSSPLSSVLFDTPVVRLENMSQVSAVHARPALTFPALYALYESARETISRLRDRAERRRKQYTDLVGKITVHSAYTYRLANAVTLLTEGVPLAQSTVPSNIPEQCRNGVVTPEMLINHLDALVQALEFSAVRLMSGTVTTVTTDIAEPSTPVPAPLPLIQADALATVTGQVSALSFASASTILSPLAITSELENSSTV